MAIGLAVVAGSISDRAEAEQLRLFAAASLREALDTVVAKFDGEHGTKTATAYAASSTLAQQIENGAPADLFVSADLDWMDWLAARNRIVPDSRINLLGNRLVLIAPADSKIAVDLATPGTLTAALAGGRLAIADPDSVPAGKYGKAALEHLGHWPSIGDRLARAENVRSALAFVARGEAPLGIVYQTDAAAEPRVRTVATFPADSHPPIIYPAALVAGGNPNARVLLDFLVSARAGAMFEGFGFSR